MQLDLEQADALPLNFCQRRAMLIVHLPINALYITNKIERFNHNCEYVIWKEDWLTLITFKNA